MELQADVDSQRRLSREKSRAANHSGRRGNRNSRSRSLEVLLVEPEWREQLGRHHSPALGNRKDQTRVRSWQKEFRWIRVPMHRFVSLAGTRCSNDRALEIRYREQLAASLNGGDNRRFLAA